MKQIAILLFTLTFGGHLNAQDTLAIATKACDIEWHAKKVTGSHKGKVTLDSGFILLEKGKLMGGTFIINMTSITCTDLKRPYRDKLIQHLRSEDFFGVERFPTAHFEITGAEVLDDDAFDTEIIGKLTIKGITEEVRFPAKIKVKDNKFVAYGELSVDRTKFDIRWGSSSFMDNLGDRAIDDIFMLKVSLGAKR